MEKLEQQELENLTELRTKVVSLKSDIADVFIHEQNCANEKARLMFEFAKANSEYNNLQKEITEKYGNISVNMQTGEITHNGD